MSVGVTLSALRGRSGLLLVALLTLLAVCPYLPQRDTMGVIWGVVQCSIPLAGVYAVSHRRVERTTALFLAVPFIILYWLGDPVMLPFLAVSACFYVLTIVVLVRTLLTERTVTANTIYSGVCGYLLLGLLWTHFYIALHYLDPASFDLTAAELRGDAGLYFSFVTLTTLGYGDIVPAAARSRSLAILEALMGQVYLTVLVAMLVGKYISGQAIEKSGE